MERIYKIMRNVGGSSIALGVVLITLGIVTGVLSIVHGAILLKRKEDLFSAFFFIGNKSVLPMLWKTYWEISLAFALWASCSPAFPSVVECIGIIR